jgi:hypothetical protein
MQDRLWPDRKVVGGTSVDPRYSGKYGIAALPSIKASFMGQPPVQDKGGAGTAGSHWRDSAFGDEMMTAYLSAPYQPMSSLSVESFRDLGYTVDSSAADRFNVSANGYPVGESPYQPESPFQPTWFDTNSNLAWSSTTIWIVACLGAAIVVFLTSCIYVKIKRRRQASASKPRNRQAPTAMSSNATRGPPAVPSSFAFTPQGNVHQSPPETNHAFIPTAEAVPTFYPPSGPAYPLVPLATQVMSDRDINNFMEITRCQDRHVAVSYLQHANGNITTAIERYLENPSRALTIT